LKIFQDNGRKKKQKTQSKKIQIHGELAIGKKPFVDRQPAQNPKPLKHSLPFTF